MKQDWLIEEELIEWFDEPWLNIPRGTLVRPRYAREMRLVNPKGEIVGRRLAIRVLREHYLVFEGDLCCTWYRPLGPEPVVFTVRLPAQVQQRWMGRSLMLYDRDNLRFRPATWQIVEGARASRSDSCLSLQCSRRLVEVYRYLPRQPFGKEAVVEWYVCFQEEPPLLGREIPICAELWWDGQLKRRHSLIHYRDATPEEQSFFRIPRGAKRRQVELKTDPFSPLNEYTPFVLGE